MRSLGAPALAACAVAAVMTVAVPAQAQFEKAVRAHFTLTITDTASGTTLYTQRTSSRFWPTMRQCEVEHGARGEAARRAIEGYGLVNADGQPVQVKVIESKCVK